MKRYLRERNKNMEIEKKYLVKKLPYNLESYKHFAIEQAYISTSPAIRVRKKSILLNGTISDTYILTIKGKGLLAREEFELVLLEDEYENLLKKTEGNVIKKCRYLIPIEGGFTLELDIFDGAFKGLVMAEIEFPNEEIAKKYTPPSFLDREVTFDIRFHNSNMSSMSCEKISELLSLMHYCD